MSPSYQSLLRLSCNADLAQTGMQSASLEQTIVFALADSVVKAALPDERDSEQSNAIA